MNPELLLSTVANARRDYSLLFFFFLNRVIRGFQETEAHKVNGENQALQA